MIDNPQISVVIPVKNGIATIKDCVEGLLTQTVSERMEIIVIDSGSTDGTLEVLKEYPEVKVISIAPESFNHGGTRNLGVKEARGALIALTVQDAIPESRDGLERMMVHFENPEVAAVSGQQIVSHDLDNNPHEWYRPLNAPQVRQVHFSDTQVFMQLPPEEQFTQCRLDNVNAMYRRSVLEVLPFDQVSFGEDMRWAKRALESGHRLVFDPSCAVAHYHHGTPEYTYKREIAVWYTIYAVFGFNAASTYRTMDYLKVIYRNVKYGVPFKWIPFNFRMMNAVNRAAADFNNAVKKGAESARQFYQEICSVVPQGEVNKKA